MKASFLVVSVLALSLAACGGPRQDDEPVAPDTGAEAPAAEAPAPAPSASDGAPVAFAICKSCHSVEKGKSMIGPSLFGIVGTKAGEVPGFTFSPAMKASGLTWDDATLDAYLTSPMKMVPGTRMTYAGQADPAKRAEIIAYLKTLK